MLSKHFFKDELSKRDDFKNINYINLVNAF